jgi:hypothetical protein
MIERLEGVFLGVVVVDGFNTKIRFAIELKEKHAHSREMSSNYFL